MSKLNKLHLVRILNSWIGDEEYKNSSSWSGNSGSVSLKDAMEARAILIKEIL